MDGIARMPWVKIKNCNLILNKKLDVSSFSEKNRMKVAVISENSYLSLGISSILSCANGGAFFFDVECYTDIDRLSPMQYDLLIADDITRAAFLLSLAPIHSLNEVMYCTPQPRRRFQEFQTGFPDETTQWRLITRSANRQLTRQEAEIRDYLATEKSTSEIALLTGKSNKRISYYKQRIKKKSYCRNDAELFRALCLMKGIVFHI